MMTFYDQPARNIFHMIISPSLSFSCDEDEHDELLQDVEAEGET